MHFIPHRNSSSSFLFFCHTLPQFWSRALSDLPKFPSTLQPIWPFLCSPHPYFYYLIGLSRFCLLSLTFNYCFNSSLYRGPRPWPTPPARIFFPVLLPLSSNLLLPMTLILHLKSWGCGQEVRQNLAFSLEFEMVKEMAKTKLQYILSPT